MLSETARQQLEKDIDKAQRDIQFSQQNAQAEMTELQNDLQGEFQQRLFPVIKRSRKRRACTPCSASATPASPTTIQAWTSQTR